MDHTNFSINDEPHTTVIDRPIGSEAVDEMVCLRDLHITLGGKRILQGCDLSIKAGESRVIIGRSGEGKSVTIKHVCGLLKPDAGEVFVDGEEISQYNEHQLLPVRKKIGLLFQNAALFDSMDVLHNVGFPLYEEKKLSHSEIEDRVVDVLRKVRLKDVVHKMPSELSGGMRKRVGLARAILQNPKILLYDEPTTGLDPVTSDAINELMIQLADELKVTSLIITHDMVSAFKVADSFSMLFEGKIIYTGTPDEVRTTDNEIIQQFVNGRAEGPLSNL